MSFTKFRARLQVDREELIRLLGTPENADTLKFQSVLADVPAQDPELEQLQSLATERRQEVAAARLDERAAQQGYSLASRFFGIDEARVGVSSSREVEGVQITGPVFQVPLPIFNQNQGMRARYQAQEKIAQLALASALQNARFEVRQAYRKLQAARNRVIIARERTIPLRHQALKLAEQQFNNMFLGISLTVCSPSTAKNSELAKLWLRHFANIGALTQNSKKPLDPTSPSERTKPICSAVDNLSSADRPHCWPPAHFSKAAPVPKPNPRATHR